MNNLWSRRRALTGLGGMLGGAAWGQVDDPTGGDPLGSMQWPVLIKKHLAGANWRFTDDVVVKGPEYA